jgi:hypothetical protein
MGELIRFPQKIEQKPKDSTPQQKRAKMAHFTSFKELKAFYEHGKKIYHEDQDNGALLDDRPDLDVIEGGLQTKPTKPHQVDLRLVPKEPHVFQFKPNLED